MTDEMMRVPVDPRVALAAERTVLAWFRTGVALMGLGFVVARFDVFLRVAGPATHGAASATVDASRVGLLIVSAGILVNAWASWRHHRLVKRLTSGEPFRTSALGPVLLGLATAVGGAIVVALLMSGLLG